MAPYREIQLWVRQRFGFVPQTCWIAHVKEIHGLPKRTSWNREGPERVKPCPPEKRPAIEAAFKHFGMIL